MDRTSKPLKSLGGVVGVNDDNVARLNHILAHVEQPIEPGITLERPRPDHRVVALLMRQTQLERGFNRLVVEVIKPVMEDLGFLLDQHGHAYAISEHSMKNSQIFDFVVKTQFQWDSAVSLHVSPHQPSLEVPTPSTPTMAFMMGAAHSKIYYKSNHTDQLGHMSDKAAFDLEELGSERVASLLVVSLERFLLDPSSAGDRSSSKQTVGTSAA